MPRGGKREGAGAKPRSDSPADRRSIRFTDAEWKLIGEKASVLSITTSEYIRRKALAD